MDRTPGLLDRTYAPGTQERDSGKVADKTFGDVMVPRFPIPIKSTNLQI